MESDYVFSILIIRQESHLNLKSYALIPIYLYQSFKIKLNLIEFLIFNFNNLTELNWIKPNCGNTGIAGFPYDLKVKFMYSFKSLHRLEKSSL